MRGNAERALRGAVVFGVGGIMLLCITHLMCQANGDYPPEVRAFLVWLFPAVHAAMGAIGGLALTWGAADTSRSVRASLAFACGFLVPGCFLFLLFIWRGDSDVLLPLIPLAYGVGACIGMLFVKPRRALLAGAAFAGIVVAIIPILAGLDHLERVGHSGAHLICVLFVCAHLAPFFGGGALLGLIAGPPDAGKEPGDEGQCGSGQS